METLAPPPLPHFIIPLQCSLSQCRTTLEAMVLPRALTYTDTQELMRELFEHYLTEGAEPFPSEEWFDNAWIHEPSRREQITRLFSCLVQEFDERMNQADEVGIVKMMQYNKVAFRAGSVCLSLA